MVPISEIRQPTPEESATFKAGNESKGQTLTEDNAEIFKQIKKTGEVLIIFSGADAYEEASRKAFALRALFKRRGLKLSTGRNPIEGSNDIALYLTMSLSESAGE